MAERLGAGTYIVAEVNVSQPIPRDGGDPTFLVYAMADKTIGEIVSRYLFVEWGYDDISIVVPESFSQPILRLPLSGLTPQLGVHARQRLPTEMYQEPFSVMRIAGRQDQISGYIAGGLAYVR